MALKILLQSDAIYVASGYGQSSKLLIEIFRKLGHEVAHFAYYGLEGCPPVKIDGIDTYSRGNEIWGDDVIEPHFIRSGADVVITNVDPFVLNKYGDKPFPWVPITPIAGDPVSDEVLISLRGALDIVSISRYGQRMLADKNVESTHIYLPIPCGMYIPLDRTAVRTAYGWPDDAYIIGHVGMNRGWRKGHDTLLRAYQLFLAEVPNSLLYMHTDMVQRDGINLQELRKQLGLEKNVIFPMRYDAFYGKSQYWMNGLYNAIDLYVQPSLNEGQGMPVWENLSTGQPIVATDATALHEAIEDTEAVAVPWSNKAWMPFQAWGYEVTADALAEAMLTAHSRWGKKHVSLQNRQRAIESVGVEEVAHLWYRELIKIEKMVRYTPAMRPWKDKPKVLQISTRVHNCGIGSYTRALMASMSEATEQECLDILELGTKFPTLPDADLVHLHYEPAIWPSDDVVRKALWDAKMKGAKVVCTYHAVIPSVMEDHLQRKLVDVAVVHWPSRGLEVRDHKLWVLGGMGCPHYHAPHMERREDIRRQYGYAAYDKVITTFGFASPGRGHYEVLEQLAPLLVANPSVKMQLIVPQNFLNEMGKTVVHSNVLDIAKDYHIGPQIHLITDFLTDLEVLNRLWLSDVGFLYMPHDTLSSSSAIRFFISASLPIVVTPSSHFEDVRRGLIRTGGFSLVDFSRTIWETLHNAPLLKQLRKETESTYEQFMWTRFGENYLQCYKRAMVG